MNTIMKWAVVGSLSVAALDLLLGAAAMLGIMHSGYYQLANLPAMMLFPSGPDSVKHSLPIWVPQMAAVGFVSGAMLGALRALTNRCSRSRAKTRAPAERQRSASE
jgi:hypothetical protein